MRWKNGLGETAEIAIVPEGATLEAFEWRVSMARLEADGPFSAFPGVDRTLTVVAGAGLRLAVAGLPAAELTPGSAPFPFPGDRAAAATLLGGPVTDLNVMTRRGHWWHRVARFESGARLPVAATATTALIVCTRGSARITMPGTTVELGELDTLRIEHPSAAIESSGTTPGTLLCIEIGR